MPANLDLVRSILAGWEGGEVNSVEQLMNPKWADPRMEVVVADGPEPVRAGNRGPGRSRKDERD